MKRLAFPILVVVLTLGFAVNAYVDPMVDWDMLPYLAIALEFEESDYKVIHERTYDLVRESVSDEGFEKLALREGYRSQMYARPDLFAQQLNFYRIKPLYILLLYSLMKLGMTPPTASVLVSVLSCVAISFIVAVWIRRYYRGIEATIFWLLVIVAARVPEFAGLSSPDALGAFLTMLSLYLLLERSKVILSAAVLILAMFARPDTATLALPLFAYLAFTNDKDLKLSFAKAGALAMTALVVYGGISYFADGYSWWTLFWHTFVGKIHAPEQFDTPISLSTYISAFARNISELTSYRFPYIVLLAFLTFVTTGAGLIRTSRYAHIVGLLLFVFVARFVLFPAIYERFLIAHYLTIMLSFVTVLHGVTHRRATASGKEPAEVSTSRVAK